MASTFMKGEPSRLTIVNPPRNHVFFHVGNMYTYLGPYKGCVFFRGTGLVHNYPVPPTKSVESSTIIDYQTCGSDMLPSGIW